MQRAADMLKLIVLSLVVASVKACCAPPQWENTGTIAGSDPSGYTLHFWKFHYDKTNQRIAMTVGIDNKTIWDFNKHLTYHIDPYTDDCTVTKLYNEFEAVCTPEDAVPEPLSFGDNTQTVLPAATYGSIPHDGFIDVDVTEPESSCIPIVSVSYDMFDKKFIYMKYANVTRGIKNSSVFIPPKSCNTSVVMEPDPRIRVHPFLRVPLRLKGR